MFEDVGGSSDNFGTSCGDQTTTFPDFVLADGAPAIPGAPGVAGTFSPQGNLSDYFLESSIGTWTLNIDDDFTIDTGTLECWCLDIYSTGEGCSPGFWGNRALKDNSDVFAGCPSIDPDITMENLFDMCNLDNCLPNNQIEFADADEILHPRGRTNRKDCDGKAGAAAQLLRQATAALLNVCTNQVNYPLSAAEIEAEVCSLLTNIDGGGGTPKEDITAFAEELAANNSQECNVDADAPLEECSNPADVTIENCTNVDTFGLHGLFPCGEGLCPPDPFFGLPAICFPDADGGSTGHCSQDFLCESVSPCPNGQSDCGVDELCIQSCCEFGNGGFDVCVPLAISCPAPPGMMSSPNTLELFINSGPTSGGFIE